MSGQFKIFRAVAALLITLALTQPQMARAAQETLAELGCPSKPVTIAVVGDSLADGIWGAFYRSFSQCGTVTVLRVTSVSDGLTRSDPDSWLARLDGARPDLTVLSVGANDLTNIRAGRTRFVYGDADWKAEYARRAASLAQALEEVSQSVVWLGLPIVGRRDYEDSYRGLTMLQMRAAAKAGVRFVDTHAPTTFGQGEFVMSAKVDGAIRQLRHSDQVHFTEIGYDLVASLARPAVAKAFQGADRDAAMGSLVLQ